MARVFADSLGVLVTWLMPLWRWCLAAQALGSGLWPVMVLLSEVVQTFILADFWYAALPCTCKSVTQELQGALQATCVPSAWLLHDAAAPCLRSQRKQKGISHAEIPFSCSYFYIRSYAEGSGVIHLAAGIV